MKSTARLLLLAPVPTALFGFAWAVKIARFFDAAAWLTVAGFAVWLAVSLWRECGEW